MWRGSRQTGLHRRSIVSIALAYLLALNTVLPAFGSSRLSVGQDGSVSFASIVCAAITAATGDNSENDDPAKGHPNRSHHCVLCCTAQHHPALDDVADAVTVPRPREGRPVDASNPAQPLSAQLTGWLSCRCIRAPPIIV